MTLFWHNKSQVPMDNDLTDAKLTDLEDWIGWSDDSSTHYIAYPKEIRLIEYYGPLFEPFVELEFAFVIIKIQFCPRERLRFQWPSAIVTIMTYQMYR